MIGRRPARIEAPDNASEALVPVYTPDPHGAAMFAGIVNGTLGHLGARPVIDPAGRSWHGYTADPQHFRGLAGKVGGGGRPRVPETTRLDQAHGAAYAPDPIQSIFEQRMTAGRFE